MWHDIMPIPSVSVILFIRFVEASYTSMEPIFAADPLMLYDFAYLCPAGDYQKLFQRIPVFISLILLSSYQPVPLLYIHVSVLH